MPTLEVINQEKKKVGTVELRDDVFAVAVNVPLIHQVLKAQLATRRQGTAKTKVKSEVRGGGKKPYKQKGTGNARRGSQRSPLMVGGGQSFGPQPRSYEQFTPKEMVRGAIRAALSDRVKAGRLLVIDELNFAKPQTKALNKVIKETLALDKVLLIDENNTNLELSGRNIPKVSVLRSTGLNVYDIIKSEWVVFTKRAVQSVESRLAPEA